jgi:hypothetical protein
MMAAGLSAKEFPMTRSDRTRIVLVGFAFGIGLACASTVARATVPTGTPTFTHPLAITNRYQPFEPGGFKRYLGVADGRRLDVTEAHLCETRTFRWNGVDVATHVVLETATEDGELAEITRQFLAQADDGSVYCFGEIDDAYEDEVVASHEGSWLVGGPSASTDPPGIPAAANPTVVMPADPELDDEFEPEDSADVDEEDVVRAVHRTIVVPAHSLGGRTRTFEDVIGIVETSRGEPGVREKQAYAPHVGLVMSSKGDDRLALVTSTLHEATPNAR